MTAKEDVCAAKHMKLCAWIVAIVVAVVGTVVGAGTWKAAAEIRQIDDRVRAVERENAAEQVWRESVRDSLTRIEKRLEKQ